MEGVAFEAVTPQQVTAEAYHGPSPTSSVSPLFMPTSPTIYQPISPSSSFEPWRLTPSFVRETTAMKPYDYTSAAASPSTTTQHPIEFSQPSPMIPSSFSPLFTPLPSSDIPLLPNSLALPSLPALSPYRNSNTSSATGTTVHIDNTLDATNNEALRRDFVLLKEAEENVRRAGAQLAEARARYDASARRAGLVTPQVELEDLATLCSVPVSPTPDEQPILPSLIQEAECFSAFSTKNGLRAHERSKKGCLLKCPHPDKAAQKPRSKEQLDKDAKYGIEAAEQTAQWRASRAKGPKRKQKKGPAECS